MNEIIVLLLVSNTACFVAGLALGASLESVRITRSRKR